MGSVNFTHKQGVDGYIFHSFKPRSSDLDDDHRKYLRQLADLLAKTPGAYLDIYGACSGTGDMAFNKKVTNDRMNKIFYFLKELYPGARYNLWWVVEPKDFDKNSMAHEGPSNTTPRGVYVYAVGVAMTSQANLPPPVAYRPEPESTPKFRHYMAPPGAWLIMAVDSFGTPAIKSKIGMSTVVLKLLNDKGELYYVKGYGGSMGVGADLDGSDVPKLAGEVGQKAVKWLEKAAESKDAALRWIRDVVLKSGDLPNIFNKLKDLNITGPNQTSGGLVIGGRFSNHAKFEDIVKAGSFTVFNVDGHGIVAGGELGVIMFGTPAHAAMTGVILGVYTSLGLGTFKLGFGAGGAIHMITSSGKLKDRVEGFSDI